MLSIRKIGAIGRTYRHFHRYRQILAVFFKYGFGDILELLHLGINLRVPSSRKGGRVERLPLSERIRLALEELGPTFIKLGQLLSTRPDLIPADLAAELARLQDSVAPFSPEQARAVVESELKGPVERVFSRFDDTPLAAASIGQVHRAWLEDGTLVAVKIQRPEIQRTVSIDLEIMLHLASLMERHITEISFYRPSTIVEEFARTLEKELDYRLEAAHMERFAQLFRQDAGVRIPHVHRHVSTARVLTMGFLEGIKVCELDRLQDAGLDRRRICQKGADVVLQQVFQHGVFHADPHPGNILVMSGQVIGLLDFGMVGQVDRRTRETFVGLLDALVKRDAARTVTELLQLTERDAEPDGRLLEKDAGDFMTRHLYRPLGDIHLGHLLADLLSLLGRHGLRLPPDIYLMMKALSTVEGVARRLDPQFDIFAHAAPFITRVRLERLSPERLAEDALTAAGDLWLAARQLPQELLAVSQRIHRDQLSLRLEHQGLNTMLATHDQISNRIAFAIIIAALIIGSALIVISQIPPLVYGISLIGIILFSAAAMMGIWLLIAILKKGRL